MKITKKVAKHATWITVGIAYFPIYLCFWLLRIISRILLAVAHYGTLNSMQGSKIIKSVFSKDYERVF